MKDDNQTQDVVVNATAPASAPIKFGFGQIGEATPKIISTIKRALNFFFAGVVVFLPAIAAQFHTTVDNISTILGITMLFINTVGIMFGVPPDTPIEIKK